MKALIPAAGVGTRLRPHTLNKPKALLPVAGKPILAHIVDDLVAAGIDGFVIIIGYHGDAVQDWFTSERPQLDITFVEQRERLGLGHAVWTARGVLGDAPFFCILGDTILKADYGRLFGSGRSTIAVREVPDPRRFGVVKLDGERVVGFVEKPDNPPSNLAIVGAYYFQDGAGLWRALDRVVEEDIRTRNEYQLTDALQLMVAAGEVFAIAAVKDWYDCGKDDTWLETNRVLLDKYGGSATQTGDELEVAGNCYIAPDAEILRSRIGPHVSVGSGTRITDCQLSDCVIGSDSELDNCRLRASLIGDHCLVEGASGRINIGDYCRMDSTTD